MSQPFFEEMETDGMMSKNPCVEDTTRHQLLQLTAWCCGRTAEHRVA